MERKRCSVCGFEKALGEFHRLNRSKDGRQHRCKECVKGYYTQPHVAKRTQERGRKWHSKAHNKAKQRDVRLKIRFGISLADYTRLMDEQMGLCSICNGVQSDGSNLAVDHDHLTGEVRGLLCRECNLALGYLRDDPNLVRRAALYLEGGI